MYSALNAALNEIRLLILQPGDWEEDIKVSLQVVSLDNEPEYIALSYVWGDPRHTRTCAVSRCSLQWDINVADEPTA